MLKILNLCCANEWKQHTTLINAFGPMCWVSDHEAINYANRLCNAYGLDTVSPGVVIAFAVELPEKGLPNYQDLSLE